MSSFQTSGAVYVWFARSTCYCVGFIQQRKSLNGCTGVTQQVKEYRQNIDRWTVLKGVWFEHQTL